MMKKLIFILIILSTFSYPLFGAELVRKDSDGTLHYHCAYCCHRVRVYTLGNGRYRVYSVSYSGIVVADDPLHAARMACREDDMAAPNSEQTR
jgi:hypothetical protein